MASLMRQVTKVFSIGMVGGTVVLMTLPLTFDAHRPEATYKPIADLPAMPCKKQYWPNTDRQCQTWTASKRETAKTPQKLDNAKLETTKLEGAKLELKTEPKAAIVEAKTESTPDIKTEIKPDVAKLAPDRAPSANAAERTALVPQVTPSVPLRPTFDRDATTVPQAVAQLTDSSLFDPAPYSAPQTIGDAQNAPFVMTLNATRPAATSPRKSDPRTARTNDGIPVTSYAANGSRRTIIVRPTSQQDIYYYEQRRLAAMGGTVR